MGVPIVILIQNHNVKVSFGTNTEVTTAHFKLSSRAETLASRLVDPNRPHRRDANDSDDDEDAIFAELEEEIENDSNALVREHAMKALKRE